MLNEEWLDQILTTPSQRLLGDAGNIKGDIVVLGAGGKMGPSLSILAKKALNGAGNKADVIAVSRFTDPNAEKLLRDNGVKTISIDLMEPGALNTLPDADNVIYMAGRKFGTDGQEHLTWAMNALLPGTVAERYKGSNIVVFSSGNVYPMVPISSGGATEDMHPNPIGEYGMSCLGRERIFEFFSERYGTRVFLFRLNYAIDLRYGVLYDIASKVVGGEPVDVSTPCFNCIWQGEANEIAIRALLHAGNPVIKMNVTGPETVSVRYAAEILGRLLGKKPVFQGEESDKALLSNSGRATGIFGYPSISVVTMLEWQAQWILDGGRSINKPTHFEERKGRF